MIAHQQRTALGRNVIPANEGEPEENPGEPADHKAQQRARQQHPDVNGGRQRRRRDDEKHMRRRDFENHRQQGVNPRGQKNAHEGQQIGCRQNGTFFFRLRLMLQQRRDRHNKEAAKETQPGQFRRHHAEGQAALAQQYGKDRQPQRAERNQPAFDAPGRKPARRETAQPDANRRGRLQITRHFRARNMEGVRRVNHNDELHQRRDREEIGIAHHRHQQGPVAADHLDLFPQIHKEKRFKFLGRIGGGNVRNAPAGHQAHHRQPDQNDAGPAQLLAEQFAQPAARHRAADDGDEGGEFQHPVAPGELAVRQDFREQAVFGRAEYRAVHPHQEYAGQRHIQMPARQPIQGQQHYKNFKNLHSRGHRALAKTVGQIPARHREQDERQRKQRANDTHQLFALRLGQTHLHDQRDDQPF